MPGSLPPVPASTTADGLPRSRALTDALLAVDDSAETPAPDVPAIRERLEHGLAGVVAEAFGPARARLRGASPGAGPPKVPGAGPPKVALVRIGHYQVASSSWAPSRIGRGRRGAGGSPSFRWTSRTARRSIGLAAVRAVLDGRASTPAEAVTLVMSDPGGPFGVGRAGPGSCADWMSALAPPARAIVAAEAASWATRLWSGVDWGRIDPEHLVVGGADRWWRWRDPSAEFAVRGRADVRVCAPAPVRGPRRGAHLVVLDGQPGVATRHALLLGALVDAVATPRAPTPSPVPGRVVGWWPDCGKAWIVPVDARTLTIAAEAVVRSARTLLDVLEPGESAQAC
jgi:hypothetical protein